MKQNKEVYEEKKNCQWSVAVPCLWRSIHKTW